MDSLSKVRRRYQKKFSGKIDTERPIPALMGDGNGNITVAALPGFVYIRVGSDENMGMAFNNRCPLRDNLPIYVGYDPITDPDRRIFQCLGTRDIDYAEAGYTPVPQVPPHHETHQYGGGDDVYVEWRRIMGLRIGRPVGFVVTLDPGVIIRAGAHQFIPTQTYDLTASVPGGGARYVLMYLNSAGTLSITNGAIKASIAALTLADCPVATGAGDFELAAVRLYSGQAAIGDTPANQDIWDLRYPQSGVWSSGNAWSLTGNTGTVPVTNYLGTNDATDVVFATNSTERMRIINAEHCLIIGDTAHGLGSPAGDNIGVVTIGDHRTHAVAVYGTGNPAFAGYKAQGTRAIPAVANSGDILARLAGRGYSNGAWPNASNARIDLIANEAFTTTSGTRVEVWATPNASTISAQVAQFDTATGIHNTISDTYTTLNYTFTVPATGTGALISYSNAGTLQTTYALYALASSNLLPLQNGKNVEIAYYNSSDFGFLYCRDYQGGTETDKDLYFWTNRAIFQSKVTGANQGSLAIDTRSTTGGPMTLKPPATITGTPTITFPDATGTVALLSTANLFTAPQTITSTTTPQFKIAYDANNYAQFAVDSGGNWAATITHAAGTPVFSFDHSITAAASTFITALTDGSGGGLRAGTGSDVLWYRGAANKWYTPDSVVSTANPAFQCNVDADTTMFAAYHADGTTRKWQVDTISHGFNVYMQDAAAYVFNIDNSGKVGIGMTPTYTLDVTGNFRCSTGFGCNGATPQTAYASGGALAAYGAGANGFDTEAHASELHAMVVKIRAALVSNGIMS